MLLRRVVAEHHVEPLVARVLPQTHRLCRRVLSIVVQVHDVSPPRVPVARQHRVVFAEVAGVVDEGDRHGHLAKQCTAGGPRTIAAAVVHQHNLVPALDPQGRDLPDERLDRAGTVVQRDDETERGLAGSGHGVRRGMGAKRFRPFPVNGAERVRGPVSGERTQLG